jgi:WD40 repeat protein
MVKAEWDGAHGQSRHILLSELSSMSTVIFKFFGTVSVFRKLHRDTDIFIECLSPSIMIPEHRLAVLFDQVKQSQIASCIYHNSEASPSLYSDHRCDRDNFPLEVVAELHEHSNEVWFVEFSHDGTKLASCGADGKVLIWDLETFKVLHTLSMHEGHAPPNHEDGVCSSAWSPDDATIVTCSMDRRARLWSTEVSLLHILFRD